VPWITTCCSTSCIFLPKKLAEEATVASIFEVPGSNLSRGTDYPEWGFSRFSLLFRGKYRDCTLIKPQLFPSTPFPALYLLSNSFDAIQLLTSLNKPQISKQNCTILLHIQVLYLVVHLCFVFGKSWCQILSLRLAILTEVPRCFPQFP
jgi:hypothetical protein